MHSMKYTTDVQSDAAHEPSSVLQALSAWHTNAAHADSALTTPYDAQQPAIKLATLHILFVRSPPAAAH
eukprot:5737990-Amphidinium_carterae.1